MCEITRRGFMTGCSAAIAALAGSRFNTMAFADPNLNEEILLVLFLRGGMDGLHAVVPIAGADRGHYEAARPNLQIPVSGPGAALDLDGQFGLHPAAAPLHDLYLDGRLSVIQAVGTGVLNRSHFDAQQFFDLGTPGNRSTPDGWLTRHLASAANIPPEVVMPSLAVGDLQPQSLLGNYETINVADPGNFNLQTGPWRWRPAQRTSLRRLFQSSSSWLHDSGVQALDAMDIIELNVEGDYIPDNGAVYPDSDFGEHLQVLAQMIKLDLGLQISTLDVGGWDTHEGQGDGSSGYFSALFGDLAQGLAAFYLDLDGSGNENYTQRLTVVVQTEFGRELGENSDHGTEHGYGNTMFVLSGNAIGGVHGDWPGLAPADLIDGTDVAVTTDFRQVLSEVLIRRMCNPDLAAVFPGYESYEPLGVVQGVDLPPILGDDVFSDGFESGDTSGWDATIE